VKQPLPLPEGVENSAVGSAPQVASRAMAMPSTMPMAAPPPAPSPEAFGPYGGSVGTGALQKGRGAGGMPKKAEAADRGAAPEPERAEEKSKPDAAAPRIVITKEEVEALSNATGVGEAVRKALLRAGCLAPGEYRVRVTIDAAGKVVRVELLASAGASSCLKEALTGLAVGSQPLARAVGTWTATIRVER